MEHYPVVLSGPPGIQGLFLRRTIDVSQTHELFLELKEEMKRRNIFAQASRNKCTTAASFPMSLWTEACSGERDGAGTWGLQRGRYAVTHTGPMKTLKYAYDSLAGGWAAIRVRSAALLWSALRDEDS